ncbi:hypothetical protein ScPMuIL_009535 [Solemya velum]
MESDNGELSEWVNRELQLNKLHEEIVAKRESLLHCSKAYLKSQDARIHSGDIDCEKAFARNALLLQVAEKMEENLDDHIGNDPVPRFSALHHQKAMSDWLTEEKLDLFLEFSVV